MIKSLRKLGMSMSAAAFVGAMTSSSAHATGAGDNKFNDIAGNIVTSIEDLPGLLTALSYLAGIMFGVMGVLKIKDHVENPSQTKLKDGAVRLAAGGALFALPIIYEAMVNTIGEGSGVDAPTLNKIKFDTK